MLEPKLSCLCVLAVALACGGRSGLDGASLDAQLGGDANQGVGGLHAAGGTASSWRSSDTGVTVFGGTKSTGAKSGAGSTVVTGGRASTGGSVGIGGSRPTGGGGCCSVLRLCNPGDRQIGGPNECPSGATCYQQTQAGCLCAPTAIWCVVGAGGSGGTGATSSSGFTAVGGVTGVGGMQGAGGTHATGGRPNFGGNGGSVTTAGAPNGGSSSITDAGIGITVISASYGLACGDASDARGNVTETVAKHCDGLESTCDIYVDNSVFGDPFFGCSKDFDVIWTCGSDPTENSSYHEAVMGEGYFVSIACSPLGGY